MVTRRTPRSVSYYVSLGSNQGDRLHNLRGALRLLRAHPRIRLGRASNVFETSPIGTRSQRPYLNCAASLHTDLSPMGLLVEFKRIEARLGRRPSRRWAPRPVDLDLLGASGTARNTLWLKLPHPELSKRRFMLAPLAQIAPHAALFPAGGLTVRKLLDRLKAPDQSVTMKTV